MTPDSDQQSPLLDKTKHLVWGIPSLLQATSASDHKHLKQQEPPICMDVSSAADREQGHAWSAGSHWQHGSVWASCSCNLSAGTLLQQACWRKSCCMKQCIPSRAGQTYISAWAPCAGANAPGFRAAACAAQGFLITPASYKRLMYHELSSQSLNSSITRNVMVLP